MENDAWDQFPDAEEWDQFPDAEPIQPNQEQLTAPGAQQRGVPASLPAPTPNMFASMDDEDAKLVYDAYSRHPKSTKDETGNVLYEGNPVPPPEGNPGWMGTLGKVVGSFGGGAGVATLADSVFGTNLKGAHDKVGEMLVGGAINTGKNLLTGGLAVADQFGPGGLAEELPGMSPEAVQSQRQFEGPLGQAATFLDENLPEYNPEGTVEHLGATGVEVAAGMFLGAKALSALKAAGTAPASIQSIATKVPKAVKYLSNALTNAFAGAVGTAATVDGKNDTLFVGEDAMIPIMKGLDNTDPGTAARIVEDRMNVLLDSMLIAYPLELGADGGKLLIRSVYQKFIKPIQGALSAGKREQQIIDSLMDAVGETVDASGKEPEKAAFWKQKILDILRDEDNSKIILSPGKEGIDDVNISLDTAATVRRGIRGVDPATNPQFDPKDADAVSKLFDETAKGVTEKTGSAGQTAIAAEQPAATTSKLLKQADTAYGGEAAIDRSREGFQDIGERQVQDAIRGRGDPTSDAQRSLRNQEEGFTRGVTQQSDLGSKLAGAEKEQFSDTFVERNRLTDEILAAEEGGTAALNTESKALLDAIPDDALPSSTLDTSIENAEPFMTPEMKKIIKESNIEFDEGDIIINPGSLKALQRLRQPLREAIAEAEENLAPGATELQALLDGISTTKNKKGKAALGKYIKHFDETLQPTTQQGLPKELAGIRKTFRSDLPKKADKSAGALRSTLTSSEPKITSHFVDVLSDEKYGKSHGKIAEYIYVDAVDQLRQKISKESLSEIDSGDIVSSLTKFRQAMMNDKLKDHVAKIDELIKLVNENKTNKKALEAILKTKVGDPTKIKEEIYKGVLGDFFTTHGIRNPNGFASFKQLFKNPQATGPKQGGRLDELIELAKKEDPVILDGMKAAWLKHFREEVFTTINTDAIAPTAASKILSESSHIMQVGEKLFREGGDRDVLDTLRLILAPALDSTLSKRSGSISLDAVSEAAKDARASVSQLVRFIYGPLSRAGTAIGAGTQTVLDTVRPPDQALKIADAIMKDPDGFLSAYERSLTKFEKRKGKEMRAITEWFIKSGVYSEKEGENVDERFDEIINEREVREAIPE